MRILGIAEKTSFWLSVSLIGTFVCFLIDGAEDMKELKVLCLVDPDLTSTNGLLQEDIGGYPSASH